MRLSFWTALGSSLVVVGAALVILVVTNILVRDRLESSVSAGLDQRLDKEISLLQARLDAVGEDMATIAQAPTLLAWLEADPADLRRAILWQRINTQFSTIIATHANYFQLRFIDNAGHEQLRVDQHGDVLVVKEQGDLQDKSGRDYVRQALSLPRDRIYVSPLNLNRERGIIEKPLRPTLRIATPVFDSHGERRGAVVVNLEAETFLPSRTLGDAHFILVDDQGAFLRHPDRSQEFGLELVSGVTLARDYAEATRKLSGRGAGTDQLSQGLVAGDGELLAFAEIVYNPQDSSHRWLAILAQPQALAYAPIDSLKSDLLRIVLGVTVIACVIGWLLARRITKPLAQITEVARRITLGDFQSDIEVRGSSEIVELGTAFKLMTMRLNQIIDDERRANEQLGRANKELARSNEDLADFAHAASHDLRTPLRALSTLPEWIQEELEGIDVPEEVNRHLQEMIAQSVRMDAVINGLLEYSRVGRTETRLQRFNPRDVTERILALLRVPDGFTVNITFDTEEITAVPPEFELILRNLVQNAVKYHDRDHGTIYIDGKSAEQGFVLEVADDGPGIPPEFHERVLQPFRTLKRRDQGGGTGLGLALVNKIVKRFGGRLDLISEAGARGTMFRITWPANSTTEHDGQSGSEILEALLEAA